MKNKNTLLYNENIQKMQKKIIYTLGILFLSVSCINTKLTIKNIDNNAKQVDMLNERTYKLSDKASDKKYGFDKDYPINLGFGLLHQREANKEKFLNALCGPNGEKITYTHTGNCCPFPTDKSQIGSGMLDVYTLTWEGNTKPLTIYLNIYEKGEILIPVGLSAKKRQ